MGSASLARHSFTAKISVLALRPPDDLRFVTPSQARVHRVRSRNAYPDGLGAWRAALLRVAVSRYGLSRVIRIAAASTVKRCSGGDRRNVAACSREAHDQLLRAPSVFVQRSWLRLMSVGTAARFRMALLSRRLPTPSLSPPSQAHLSAAAPAPPSPLPTPASSLHPTA